MSDKAMGNLIYFFFVISLIYLIYLSIKLAALWEQLKMLWTYYIYSPFFLSINVLLSLDLFESVNTILITVYSPSPPFSLTLFCIKVLFNNPLQMLFGFLSLHAK